MISKRLHKTIFVGIAIVALSGCVYRMDVPQGNRIDAAVIEQLKIGMSRNQVEFLMGSPAIIDLYRPDEWHYVYFLKNGGDGSIEKRRIKLAFSGDLLATVEGAEFLD